MSTDIDLDALEIRGKDRAAKNKIIWFESGETPPDNFDDQESGITIHDPWMTSCGRFAVDPYKEYGRAFVEWLLLKSP